MAYEQLHAHQRKLAHLAHVQSMIEWDHAAMMPRGGGPARAEAMGTLDELKHELATDPRVDDWIEAASSESLDAWDAANLAEIRRAHERESCLPASLVGARARARAQGQAVWQEARPKNDWAAFAPTLEGIVSLEREAAACIADRLGCSPYEALLDTYEPGADIERIDALFAELREFLVPFIDVAIERSHAADPVRPAGPFAIEAQRQLGLDLMRVTGFDFEHGRLDVSAHPFCGGVPTDVRITTRYDEDDYISALMGVLHETGHAKYEQGLPRAWIDQPVGHARSMSLHESQSLLQEMQICRSRPFLRFLAPKLRAAFPDAAAKQPRAFTDANLAAVALRVRRSKIRVDADEVTYPCHVMLRTTIERELIAGTMRVADIPEAWDAQMKSLLDIDTHGDFANGCMQDVHWAAGAFGYFPTYTLGALAAAQFFRAIRDALPNVDGLIEAGEFAPINAWLAEHVWGRASSVSVDTLITEATGEALGTGAFIEHLERRYGAAADSQ